MDLKTKEFFLIDNDAHVDNENNNSIEIDPNDFNN
jgi:hypothetical protein